MDNAVETKTGVGSWIEVFTGVLVAPVQTFRTIAENCDDTCSVGAACLLLLVFALDGLHASSPKELEWAVFNVPAAIVIGVIAWMSLSALLAIIAACFNAPSSRIRAIFAATGWAFAPWIFMGPISCYRNLLGPGFVMLALVPLLWVISLQIIAISQTFQFKPWQTLALVFVAPILLQVLGTIQFIQTAYLLFSSFVS